MPILDSNLLSLADLILLAAICVGMPVWAELSREKMRAFILSGASGARRKLYRGTIVILWALTLPILGVWWLGARRWPDLGFMAGQGWGVVGAWVLAGLVTAFFSYQYLAVCRSEEARQHYCKSLEAMGDSLYFMPVDAADFRLFRWTAITAGITEEIIFRGFLFWALGQVMPLWSAAVLSLALFTWLHRYQGFSQMVPVFLLGLIMTVIVLVSGSLWPAIALHVAVDLLNGETVRAARARPAVQLS